MAFAVDKIFGSASPICSQQREKLSAAVENIKTPEPRVEQCESSWSAFSVLSPSLRQRQRSKSRKHAVCVSGGPEARGGGGGGGFKGGGRGGGCGWTR